MCPHISDVALLCRCICINCHYGSVSNCTSHYSAFHAGAAFQFEQPIYNVLESGGSQTVCVLLVMGSLNRQVVVNIQTGIGTATGGENN